MKKRADKRNEVEALHRELEQTQHLFVTGYEQLNVALDFELRKTIRAVGGTYRVIKNRLAEKAAQGTRAEKLLRGLSGMTSLAYTAVDPVALAKALTTYAKNNPSFTFKAGMVEGRVIDGASIRELADLPSREEMLGRLLFLIQAPAQRVVAAFNAVGRNLALVLDQSLKQNRFSS